MYHKHNQGGLTVSGKKVIICLRCAFIPYIPISFWGCLVLFLLALIFWSLSHTHSLSLWLTLSVLHFSKQREHQRNQAGLVYWKQMADQRQERHSFMKRSLNMPRPCRGACPWMTAAWCVYLRERSGLDSWFSRLPVREEGPLITVCPCIFFFHLHSSADPVFTVWD